MTCPLVLARDKKRDCVRNDSGHAAAAHSLIYSTSGGGLHRLVDVLTTSAVYPNPKLSFIILLLPYILQSIK